MNSRNNRSIDKKPNHVKNSDFRSILYSKPLREYKKPKLGIGDRFRISKYDSLFRKGNKPQFTQENFEIVAIATKKTCNIYNQGRTRVWIHLQSSWFPKHLRSFFQRTLSVHLQISWRSK